MSFNIEEIRSDFPVLQREVAGRPLVYMDNAATALKPRPVIEAVSRYLGYYSANIHRGKHLLSEEASEAYEIAREKMARFLNADKNTVIFVRGATEGVGMVAAGLGLQPDENVVGTILEHHSNILPWSQRCEFRAAPLLPSGLPDLEAARALIDDKTRLVTLTHCSNVTGVVTPASAWSQMAHDRGVPLLLDAAQSAAHRPVDMQELQCDFLVLSGHKLCGPTGAGVLCGTFEALDALEPATLGGGAVSLVRPDFSYELRDLPWRLEAGTPDVAGVIGMAAAADYLSDIGMPQIEERNSVLSRLLEEHVATIEGLQTYRPTDDAEASCIIAFDERDPTYPADYFARLLSDSYGVMTRGGHHCAHPLHDYLEIQGTVRASLQFYNTDEEVVYLGQSLAKLLRLFKLQGGAAKRRGGRDVARSD